MVCKLAVSLVSLVALTSVGHAEDYDWSGIYGGLVAGTVNGDVQITEIGELDIVGTISGASAGILAGANFQNESIVFGIDGDIQLSSADGVGVPGPGKDYAYDHAWDGHLRARAGYAFNNVLPYIAGGVSWGSFEVTQISGGVDYGIGTFMGYNYGAGIDIDFSKNLIGRLEYVHDEFNGMKIFADDPGYEANIANDLVRAAVIFKFGK